jgi:hypothetical protein
MSKENQENDPLMPWMPPVIPPPIYAQPSPPPKPISVPTEEIAKPTSEKRWDICIPAGFLFTGSIWGLTIKVPPIDICLPNPLILTADVIWDLLWFVLDKLAGEYYGK